MVSSTVRNVLSVIVFVAMWIAPHVAERPSPNAAAPDEGMWTFDNLPLAELKAKYGFEPTKEWIDHVRMAAVRFDTGGSGSFISPNGLVLTNHHVALTTVDKLAKGEHDYVKDGFSSRQYGSEPKGPDLTIRHLVEIRDLTAAVNEATAGISDPIAIAQARGQIGQKAAQAATDKAKNIIAEPVALYSGAELHLYIYKVYDDVRLVFAPEQQVAFYGGDPDNFTYPRFCLDFALFRVYEDGKPIDSSTHYFKWNPRGAADGELVFVPGHPGSTKRLFTYAQMEHERDVSEPLLIRFLAARGAAMAAYMAQGEEQAKEVRDDFFGVENSLKAFRGHLRGLQSSDMMARQREREAELVKKADDPELVRAIESIAAVQKARGELFPKLVLAQLPPLVGRRRVEPSPFQLFIMAVESGGADPFEKEGAPQVKDLDRKMVEAHLSVVKESLPADDPLVVALLGDKTPAAAADAILRSKLYDADFRASLLKGGKAALAASDDPLVRAILAIDKADMEAVTRFRAEVIPAEAAGQAKLAAARFKVFGKSHYPDATFTLRLAFGTVKGYEAGTAHVPYKTTFAGLYERNTAFDNKPPYDLPARWLRKRGDFNMSTPFNFVCTADIIGGNSGSPVINQKGEVVGLIFDGNIESLASNYWYDDSHRAVSVHTAGIIEALWSVYDEKEVIAEILGG